MIAMMANPKKRPYQFTVDRGMSIQEYNTRKKYADMGFSERMTDFFYGAEKAKRQEELQERMKANPTPPVSTTSRSPASSISSYGVGATKPSTPLVRDASGYMVNPNRVTSLRPGAGINPTQSTYGFSSMQPSNRAGEVYTIDQWGNKRYL